MSLYFYQKPRTRNIYITSTQSLLISPANTLRRFARYCVVQRNKLFRSEFFFRTTREFEYLFFLSCKARKIFQNLTLDYMTKTLNQIIIFFLHQNQNIFFSNIGNQNIFLEKNHSHPLQVKWSFPNENIYFLSE